MRARRARLLGWATVGLFAAVLVAVALVEIRAPDLERPGSSGAAAARELVEAWERSRRATFVTVGTFERHSAVTGASISSEDFLAQRPPRRLHRQLGGVEGRDDDRLLVCPAPPDGQAGATGPCRLGAGGGPTYAESVAAELEGLRSLLLGPSPLYSVERGEPGCFELDQVRIEPRAPFGAAATFCFDEATGAPVRRLVRHEGGVEERLVVTSIRARVTDADLEP